MAPQSESRSPKSGQRRKIPDTSRSDTNSIGPGKKQATMASPTSRQDQAAAGSTGEIHPIAQTGLRMRTGRSTEIGNGQRMNKLDELPTRSVVTSGMAGQTLSQHIPPGVAALSKMPPIPPLKPIRTVKNPTYFVRSAKVLMLVNFPRFTPLAFQQRQVEKLIDRYNTGLPAGFRQARGHMVDGAPSTDAEWFVGDPRYQGAFFGFTIQSPEVRWHSPPDARIWQQSFLRMWSVKEPFEAAERRNNKTALSIRLTKDADSNAEALRRIFQAAIKFEWHFAQHHEHCLKQHEHLHRDDHEPQFLNWRDNPVLYTLTRSQALQHLQGYNLKAEQGRKRFQAELFERIPSRPGRADSDLQHGNPTYFWGMYSWTELSVCCWQHLASDSDLVNWFNFVFYFIAAAIKTPLASLIRYRDDQEGLQSFLTGTFLPVGSAHRSRDSKSKVPQHYNPPAKFEAAHQLSAKHKQLARWNSGFASSDFMRSSGATSSASSGQRSGSAEVFDLGSGPGLLSRGDSLQSDISWGGMPQSIDPEDDEFLRRLEAAFPPE